MLQNNEPQKVLWILVCDDGFGHQLKAFYAVSEKDAQEQSQQWLKNQSDRVTPISLLPYPRGFTMVYAELPGKV